MKHNTSLMFVSLVWLIAGSIVACKARQPEEGGLLSSDGAAAIDDQPSLQGAFSFFCRGDIDGSFNDDYLVQVRGAVSDTDESQPLNVTVSTVVKGQVEDIYKNMQGRGLVAWNKPVFVGFENGVLTGELNDSKEGEGDMVGVLTVKDRADAVQVRCHVQALKPAT